MKVIGHEMLESGLVSILFDKIEVTLPGTDPLKEISKSGEFYEIAKKYGLTCMGLRHPDSFTDKYLGLYTTEDGYYDSEPVKLVHTLGFPRLDGRREVVIDREYSATAEEVFNLMTGKSLKELWQAYCIESGIPLPKGKPSGAV